MMFRAQKHGLVTCPWCDWKAEANGDTIEACVAHGQQLTREHNAKEGHPVKPGREARAGYRKGNGVGEGDPQPCWHGWTDKDEGCQCLGFVTPAKDADRKETP